MDGYNSQSMNQEACKVNYAQAICEQLFGVVVDDLEKSMSKCRNENPHEQVNEWDSNYLNCLLMKHSYCVG